MSKLPINPYEALLIAMTPGGIEASEKAGQMDQARRATLPKDGLKPEVARAFGFTIGEPADDLFVNVTMPAGWQKVLTDHSMWTRLLDDQGRLRASIFYKAAFYDRSAHMGWSRRYTATFEPIEGYGDDYVRKQSYEPYTFVYRAFDQDQVIWESEPVVFANMTEKAMHSYSDPKPVDLAAAWLDKNKPDWRDVTAYWD